MAEESEKRFHAIMDKLFHAPPKSKFKPSTSKSTSLSRVQLSRGTKHPYVPDPKSIGGAVEELCRPWDRGDLLRRLATFKSMTWFAKPEVVNAVNCARRGWVNIDMDIIACESCGARLLFSTPSSWAHHQVEKAALVFSLKLDNGHKLLCPWVDNACDETLAQFPPTPAQDLVDNYKKRHDALLQLVALPVISSSAIDYMRNLELEHFIHGSSAVEYGNKYADASITEYLGNECEAILSVLYYQAQKLISLCGWEPRLLPYIVDCKDRKDQSVSDGTLSNPSYVVSNRQSPSISVYSSCTEENMEANEDSTASNVQYDPSSVVLDCSLCGASIGLWAFCTAPRPVEFIRLIGYTEVYEENNAAHNKDNVFHSGAGASGTQVSGNENHVDNRDRTLSTATAGTASSKGLLLNLNLTIAGGPLPTKQNFRPTISLPVVGQNLRAQFASESELNEDQSLKNLFQGDKGDSSNSPLGQGFQPEDIGLVHGRRHEDAHCRSTSKDLLPCLDSEISEPVRNDSNIHMSLEGADISENEIPETIIPEPIMENPLENGDSAVGSSSKIDKLTENAAVVGTVETAADMAADGCLQQNPETDTTCGIHGDSHKDHGVGATMQPVNSNIIPSDIGKELKKLPLTKAMEFDPIRQHRHFCPWIVSSGNSAPGWKQTLYALQRQKEFSCPSSTKAPSSSFIEVDDPVSSVKKLFSPPSAKRKKLAHGSS